MSKRFGFSLIELVLSIGLLSILLTIFLKLNALEYNRSQVVWEEQNLMAYVDVLEWTLKNTRNVKVGFWSGFQDFKNQERKFVYGDKSEKVCSAEVKKDREIYRAILRGNEKVKPIEFFISQSN